MVQHSYVDFDLQIGSNGAGGYLARVLKSPAGETPPSPVTIPFSDLEIENFLLKVGRPRRQASRGTSAPEVKTVRDFGGRLFDAVFQGSLRQALNSSLDQVEGRKNTGLRLRLRLGDCPELAELPWEYLYNNDARRFLALSEWTPVVRYLDLPGRIRPLAVRPPLRIVAMAASPSDFEPLDVRVEWEKVRTALDALQQAGRVLLERVPGGTLADLRRTLRQGEYHVFHFIGHGRYDPALQDGVLALEDPSGRAQPVTGADLGGLLYDHRSLRLAVLNSCEGARGGISDPYSGTAQSLLMQGIPAVVGMQFEITDQAAITFSQGLYEAVADGYPLDAAVAEARNAIRDEPNPLEWATPVLYLRAPNGRIFDVQAGAGSGQPPVQDGQRDKTVDQSDKAYQEPPISTSAPVRPEPGPPASSPPQRPGRSPDWLTNTRDRVAQNFSSLRRKGATGQQEPSPVGPDQFRTQWPAPPPEKDEQLPPHVSDPAVPPAARIRALQGLGSCVHAAVGPNDFVAVAGTDGVVRVLATRTDRVVAQCALPHHKRPQKVSWGPWTRHLACVYDQGIVVVWDLQTEVPNRVLRGAMARVDAVAFSHDGRWLAVAAERRLKVFDSSGAQVRDVPVPADDTSPAGARPFGLFNAVAFAPDDRHVVVAGDDGVVRQLDVHGRLAQTWRHPSAVLALAVSEGGLATGSAVGRVAFWRWDGVLLQRADHDGRVELAAFASDGQLLVTAAQDRTTRVWAGDGTALTQSVLGRRPVGVGFLSDGSGYLTVTVAGEVDVWAMPARTSVDDSATDRPT